MSFGIPPLLTKTQQVINEAALLVADAIAFTAQAPTWGIYKDGRIALAADSTISLDIRKDYRISDFPQELGAFNSYNKVEMPYDARVQLAKGGTPAEREAFLATLDTLAASLDLYQVMTPEKAYANANIVHWELMRKAHHGVNLLTVEIWLMQVRITQANQYTNTKQPSGASVQSGGQVQGQTASSAQTAAAKGFR